MDTRSKSQRQIERQEAANFNKLVWDSASDDEKKKLIDNINKIIASPKCKASDFQTEILGLSKQEACFLNARSLLIEKANAAVAKATKKANQIKSLNYERWSN